VVRRLVLVAIVMAHLGSGTQTMKERWKINSVTGKNNLLSRKSNSVMIKDVC